MLKEFKTFVMRGNIVDLAVGIIVGGAFQKIVSSLVNDIVMPTLSIFTGKIDFSNLFISLDGNKYSTLAQANEAGAATLNYGLFITTVIDFLVIAFCIFIFIKQINKLNEKLDELKNEEEKPETKTCGFCKTEININAIRCPNCTSELEIIKEEHSEQIQ